MINNLKRRRTLSNLKKQDINDLAEKATYILSLCMNAETGDCFVPIEHHLTDHGGEKNNAGYSR